jgi:hypothetical protein
MKRTTVRTLFIALAAASAAGCQAPAGTLGPSGTPARAASPSPGPAATIAPTPASSAGARQLEASRAELAPGRYTREGFVPRITFAVERGWRAVQVMPGFFDIQQDAGSPDVIAVQWTRPDGIYEAPDAFTPPTTAQAAVEALGRNDGLTVIESSESRMDGRTGSQVTVENPAGADGDVGVLHVPPGPLLISPGRRLWIAFFDTPEGMLAIMVGGSVERWEEALLAAEPVLESVTIGR